METAIAESSGGNLKFTESGVILARLLKIFPPNSSSIKLFNHFINRTLPDSILKHVITVEGGDVVRFINLKVHKPHYDKNGTIYPLYPQKCRTDRLSYVSKVTVDVIQERVTNNIPTIVKEKRNMHIGSIPIMKGCEKCNLFGLNNEQLSLIGEDPVDPDGYFIIGGVEKTILYQEQLATNRIFLMMNDPKQGPSVRLTTSDAFSTHVNEIVLDKKYRQVVKLKLTSFKSHSEKSSEDSALMAGKASEKKYGTLNVLKIFQLLNLEDVDVIIDKISRFIEPENRVKCINKFSRTITDFKISTSSKKETIDALSKKIFVNFSKGNITEQIDAILYKELFQHLNDSRDTIEELNEAKIDFLCIMVAEMLKYMIGVRPLSNRNSWSNKKTQSASGLMQQLFNASLRKILASVNANSRSRVKKVITFEEITGALTPYIVTDSFFTSFNTPNWGVKGGQTRPNIAQTLSRESLIATHSHLSTIDVNVSRTGNVESGVKMIQMDSFGFICSVATPEGENCGLLKNFSVSTGISEIRDDNKLVREYLKSDLISQVPKDGLIPFMLNAKFIGWCNGDELRNHFLNLRRNGKIPIDTAIVINGGWLYLDLSPYRPIRPLLIVSEELQDLEINIQQKRDSSPIEWLTTGCMEYLSPWEQEQKEIKLATSYDDILLRNQQIKDAKLEIEKSKRLLELAKFSGSVQDGNVTLSRDDAEIRLQSSIDALNDIGLPYTHCEIDPKTQYSIQSNLIHYLEHNQAPRNTYQASMAKQSLCIYHRNYMNRFDGTVKQLPISQSPLITTETYNSIGLNKRNSGLNVNTLFAAMPYTEEDAFIFSKEYLQSGGHRILKNFVYKTTVRDPTEKLGVPDIGINENVDRYAHIHKIGPSAGLPKLGAYLRKGDCVIGRISTKIGESRGAAVFNSSVFMKVGEEGIVEKVSVSKSTDNVETVILVKLRVVRIPNVGDKFAPRNAQKATIALIISDVNLPTSTRGIAPSVIANPSCLPSRMTVSYPMEMMFSKYAALTGTTINGSAFAEDNNITRHKQVNDLLKSYGRYAYGYEKMYSGLSGIEFDGLMNMSLVYFQALRHHVKDKIQSRGTGQVTNITRQPPKGRSKQGGLRFGEMERDAIISHGATSVLLERLMYVSDAYKVVICKQCGTIVTVDTVDRGCKMCGSRGHENFVTKIIPYAVKLLIQFLGTMGMFESLHTVSYSKYSENVLKGSYKDGIEDEDEDDFEDDTLQEGIADDVYDDMYE